jgi:NAD-dependent DNA ligase
MEKPQIICFTGPAHKSDGSPVLRADLKKAAERNGMRVRASFTMDCDMLVASRFDTTKARKAMERGKRVMDYGSFIEQFLDGYVPEEGEPDPWVDDLEGYEVL